MSNKSVIVDAVRSPIGIKNGNLVGIRPDDLAAQVVKGLLKRNPNLKPEQVEDVVLGCDPLSFLADLQGKRIQVLRLLPVQV